MNNFAWQLEASYPELLVTESEARGLYYCTSSESEGIAIITHKGRCILNSTQCRALAKEIRDVYAMYAGRGRR